MPWLLLALIFAIPGVYLEWPSDPWEHLRRITEWATHPLIANHSAGYKSFYFFAYSWVGWLSPMYLLSWLNVYYVGVGLLLAWQYYLLAKAVGLDRRWAFLSVIVNVLTFGNVCFSFYRYYALASTVFAQLGAVALTRIALEYAKGIGQSAEGQGQKVKGEERWNGRPLPVTGSAERSCASGENQESKAWPRRFWKTLTPSLSALRRRFAAVRLALCPLRARSAHYSLLRLGAASGALLLLIAYNHIQGLGIAGLGVGAVIIWRLIEWKRSMIFWLGAVAVVLSVATVLWWPRQPQIDAIFRPYGWLNAWYGFNLLAWPSPAADRMMQILGLFGLLNLVAGLILLCRNHIVGWLTLTPIVALSLPVLAIPFADSIATEIIVYHRMFLAIPSGLALIMIALATRQQITGRSSVRNWFSTVLAAVPVVCLSVLALTPSSGPWYNRGWQTLSVTPADLQLRAVLSIVESTNLHYHREKHLRLRSTGAVAAIFNAITPHEYYYSDRPINQPVVDEVRTAIGLILSSRSKAEKERGSLIRDPLATDPSSWTTLYGPRPIYAKDIGNFGLTTTAVQNPPGKRIDVFTSDLIPVTPRQRYRIELSIRQLAGPTTVTFLAVAWYNDKGRLLAANDSGPNGAGNPMGWVNAAYSHFGPFGNMPFRMWMTYQRVFGGGEAASIPPNARAIRIGALLNYNAVPGAIVQLTNVRLWAESQTELATDVVISSDDYPIAIVPKSTMFSTIASQAALSSSHWPPQQAMVDMAGAEELAAAVRTSGGRRVDQNGTIFDLTGKPTPPVSDR